MAADFDVKLERLKASLKPAEISHAGPPDIVRESFVGRSGKFLVRIYPREDIWQDAALARFVAAIESADPNVTGTPVQSYAIASAMRRGYEEAAILALVAVVLFVLADLRNLGETAPAILPLRTGRHLVARCDGNCWAGISISQISLPRRSLSRPASTTA